MTIASSTIGKQRRTAMKHSRTRFQSIKPQESSLTLDCNGGFAIKATLIKACAVTFRRLASLGYVGSVMWSHRSEHPDVCAAIR